MSDDDDDWGDNAPATVLSPSFDDLLEAREAAELDAAELEPGDLEPVDLDPGAPTRVVPGPSFDEVAPLEGRVTDPDPPPSAEPAAEPEQKFVAEQRELPSYLTARRLPPATGSVEAAPPPARRSPLLMFLLSASVVFFAGACLLGIAFALLR